MRREDVQMRFGEGHGEGGPRIVDHLHSLKMRSEAHCIDIQ
jgi:hypothetical protein